jgi:ZIP family zinc transporter
MTSPLVTLLLITLIAGLAIPVGAALATYEKFESHWLELEVKHFVMAFGGGALLSAIALVLVPKGIENVDVSGAVVYFVAGGFAFMMLDIILKKIQTPASLATAMLADFIPESIALGAIISAEPNEALFLGALITLQNLPEGFNAFCELKTSRSYKNPKRLILIFALLALSGPLAGVSGYYLLSNDPETIGAIMLFASGGILYSVFQDIAPQVTLRKHWLPPMGAVFGFVAGIAGFMLTSH